MDLKQFESAIRHANEKYDGVTHEIDTLRMRKKLTQDEAKEELEYARRDNWWELRTLVNQYLYNNRTPFVYYGRITDDKSK